MYQKEWIELADILVNYSVRVRPGDKVFMTLMEPETIPLGQRVYSKVVQAGGFPFVEFQSAWFERELMMYGNQAQLDWIPEPQANAMKWADAYIGLRGNRNPYEFNGIDAEKIKSHRRAVGHISALRTELERWVLIRVPNESFAQQAEMSLDEMMNFFFASTLKDWEQETKRYQEIQSIFEKADEVHIVGQETDLRFRTRGRKYLIGDGSHNMPDGEIYTSPIEDSVQGKIYFEFPGVYAGQRIEGITLEFKDGLLVSATSSTNQKLLEEIVHMDEGASRVGEFGVGTNYSITRFFYDILFDEKIGGTIHIALGRGYRETGGRNYSALHWDIIKDLRQQGEIYLDGEMVFRNGNFLF